VVQPDIHLERASDVMVELARERTHRAMFGFSRSTVRLGRYLVLDRVGAGAMGVVFAALDPELGRKVALKLVSARPDHDGPSPHERLVREAQALAKLTHPNVVVIHDVGVTDGGPDAAAAAHAAVFIAMEFIEGETLRAWLARAQRPWADVVAVMSEAGRGLAAAHAAGLVHRDFKPDNVMIGVDPHRTHGFGRVRVTDFGLARAEAFVSEGDQTQEYRRRGTLDSVPATPTVDGVAVGTPAYMSPEQHDARPVDARSDQFAFCVTLWEALFGVRPFTGRSIAELAVAIQEGAPQPPMRSGVPRWLAAVVARGLAADPAARYPDMDALLAALSDDPTRRRRRRWLAGLVGLALVGSWGAIEARRAAQLRACASAGAELDEVWATSSDTADRVLPGLDAYAQEWSRLREQLCVTAMTTGTRTDEMRARSEACLDERRAALATLVELLAHAEPRTVLHAAESAAALPPVAPCGDDAWLLAQPSPPTDPVQRDEIAAARRTLAQQAVRTRLGEPPQPSEVQALLERARVLGWQPLVAEIGYVLGLVHAAHGDNERAEAQLVEAYFVAHAAAYEQLAADIASELCAVVGRQSGRVQEGKRWGRLARAGFERSPAVDDLRGALLMEREASIDDDRGAGGL
jgi:eukaryotic-like serine/threonine-protein kinase